MKPVFGDYVIFEHCMPFNVTRAYEEAQGVASRFNEQVRAFKEKSKK